MDTQMILVSDAVDESIKLPGFKSINWTSTKQENLTEYEIVLLDFSVHPSKHKNSKFNPFSIALSEIYEVLNCGNTVVIFVNKGNRLFESSEGFLNTFYESDLQGFEVELGFTVEDTKQNSRLQMSPMKNNSLKSFLKRVDNTQYILKERVENIFGDTTAFIPLMETQITKKMVAAYAKRGAGYTYVLPAPEDWTIIDPSMIKEMAVSLERGDELDDESSFLEPSWLQEYLVDTHKDIDNKMSQLRNEKRKYDHISLLLYGLGEGKNSNLVKSVKSTLEDLGFTVKLTEKSAPIDLKARSGKVKLAIEVTGTKSKINQKSNKVSQVNKYARSENKEDEETICVFANTYCSIEPRLRTNKENFTKDAIAAMPRTKLCLMTTYELYSIWKAIQEEKLSLDTFVGELRKTDGIFDFNALNISLA